MICIHCVTPTPLKKFVHDQGSFGTCQYCEQSSSVVEPKQLFDYVLERVDENLATQGDLSTWEETCLYDLGTDDIAISTIDVVLAEWFDLGNDPYLNDFMAYLPKVYHECDNGDERHFYVDGGGLDRNFFEERWEKFVDGIRHEHRFFNSPAKNFLDSIFGFLSNVAGMLKPEVIRSLQLGAMLYRARTVRDYDAARAIEKDPVRQLGPTPRDKAGSQRMTPNGISALYCALERDTCLSEIRSITGDRVVSGAMTPINEIKLLDLTRLADIEPPKLTLFDVGYLEAMHLKTFINSLVKKMSRPRGRNDDLSYLSTQVVFEYLRQRFGQQVDGLVFPSVQTGEIGTNVVLFPEACVISETEHVLQTDDDMPGALAGQAVAQYKKGERLAFVAKSLRFHKVVAIETRAHEHEHLGGLFHH